VCLKTDRVHGLQHLQCVCVCVCVSRADKTTGEMVMRHMLRRCQAFHSEGTVTDCIYTHKHNCRNIKCTNGLAYSKKK